MGSWIGHGWAVRLGVLAVLALTVPAAPAAADGVWSTPDPVSAAPPPQAEDAEVVVDRHGTATATWIADDTLVAAQRPHGGDWSEPEALSAAPVTDVYDQHLTVGPDGRAAVAWIGFDEAPIVQVASRAPGDDAWSQPETVSEIPSGRDAADPSVAAGPDGRLLALWTEQVPNFAYVVRGSLRPGGPAEPFEDPQTVGVPTQSSVASDPVAAFDADGDATAVWSVFQGPNPGVSRMEFADRPADASTWTGGAIPGAATPASALIFSLDLAHDVTGGVAVVWWHGDPPGADAVTAARRPAGGAWDVDRLSAAGDEAALPQVVLDAEGGATAAWIGGDGTAIRTAAAPPEDDWTEPDDVAAGTDVTSTPDLAGRPDGRALLVWATPTAMHAAERPPGGTFDPESVRAQTSTDPRVAYDPRGGAVAVWSEAGRVLAAERRLPLGDVVAFVHDDRSLRLAEADGGGGGAALTDPDGPHDQNPAWAPDGGLLAFDSERSGTQELWTITPEAGAAPRRVAGPDGTANQGMDPTFGPDGRWLAFVSTRDGRVCPSCAFNTEIYRVPVTGGTAERLTDNAAYDTQPAWSPDGSRIAFVRTTQEGDVDLWVMDADGTDERRLTEDVELDQDPAWSPDGSRIAWTRSIEGDTAVWVMDAGGTGTPQRVAAGREPTWSPGCAELAVTRTTGSGGGGEVARGVPLPHEDVYAVRLDGDGAPRRLTTSTDDDDSAAWRPGPLPCDPVAEPGTPAVAIADATATERDAATAPLTFTLTLDRAAATPASVAYATAPGTAATPADFAAASGTVTFAPGETEATVTVAVAGDRLDEPAETLTVALASPDGLTVARGTATGTIVDDDPVTTAEGFDAYALERAGAIDFPVELRRPSGRAVTLSYATADHDARAPGDYASRSGTVTIPAGATQATIRVPVVDDAVREADYERLYLDLGPADVPLVARRLVGTIVDDEHGVAPAPRYPEDELARGGRDASAAAPPVTPAGRLAALPRLVVASGPLHASAGGTVALTLRCGAGPRACRGRVALRLRGRTLGSRSIRLAAGRSTTTRVRLGRAARRALRRGRRVRVQVVVTLGTARSVRTTTLIRKDQG